MLRPQHLFGLGMSPLVHGVMWSLALNILAYVGFSLRRAPSPIERLQANLFVPSDLAPIAPSFRLWRSSVTVAELTQTVARYLGEARTRAAFENFAAANRISLEPGDEADFRLMRYAEHILASAIGAASSRLVLSLLLRKRTLSTKSALKLLDDANAAIQYNREILQTALDHVRQGIAVFDKEQQLICWNRQFGDILDLPPSLIRAGINLADLLRFNARRGDVPPDRLDEFVHQQLERYLSGNEPFRERFAEPGVAIEVRANRMPDGGIVTTFTDITASVEAAEALERANETLERRVQERTEELTRAERGARPRQGRGRRRQHLQDQVPGRRQPRHPAAAERGAALRHQPDRAPARRRRPAADRQHRRLAGSRGGDLRRAARHLAARHRRAAAGILQLPHRRPDAADRGGVHAAGGEQAAGADLHAVRGCGAVRPAAAAAADPEPRFQRHQVHACKGACWWAAAGAATACTSTSTTPASASRPRNSATSSSSSSGSTRARASRAAWGSGSRSSSAWRGCSGATVELMSTPGRGSHFAVSVPLSGAAPVVLPARAESQVDPGQLAGTVALCIDNEPAVLDGMETLLRGWGCDVITAPNLAAALATVASGPAVPNGLLVDYHLDSGNGIDAIEALRKVCGELPAILITADRSPAVREQARAQNVQVLHKPVKPAALRALLAQWRMLRVAAAE